MPASRFEEALIADDLAILHANDSSSTLGDALVVSDEHERLLVFPVEFE